MNEDEWISRVNKYCRELADNDYDFQRGSPASGRTRESHAVVTPLGEVPVMGQVTEDIDQTGKSIYILISKLNEAYT